ncbi:MAG: DUF4363 family protein [Clostridia bacterium]|nr:DUF4363 family protein [Clostridia bacterium]
MNRTLGIILICLFLIGLCIADELLVDSTLHQIKLTGNKLYAYAQQLDSVNDKQLITEANNLLEFWSSRESILSFLSNHKDIREMGIELTKMIAYAKQDIREEFNASLELVIYYTDAFHQVMGISFQNIF